jgi:N-acetylglutamate synthase-like GNAT family acetyltransferase
MTLPIRPARASDWPGIRELLVARHLPTEGAETHLPDFLVATSETNGAVLGVAGLERHGDVGLLRSVAVVDDLAGKGLGTALVRALLERARGGGVRDVYLLTTTAPDWFPRFGFTVARREEFPEVLNASEELRGACPSSAVAMRAVLASRAR